MSVIQNYVQINCWRHAITPCGKQQEIVCYVKNINNKPIYPLMRVEKQSVTTGREIVFFCFLPGKMAAVLMSNSGGASMVHLSFSSACAMHPPRCFLPTQHLFDLIRSQEIDGCSIIVKITHRKSLSPLHPWKCQRARCAGSLSRRMKVFGWISSLVFTGQLWAKDQRTVFVIVHCSSH